MTTKAHTLSLELEWMNTFIRRRLEHYLQGVGADTASPLPAPPNLEKDSSPYARLVRHYRMSTSDRLLLILALAPSLQPSTLDWFMTVNAVTGKPYTEFGGIKGTHYTGFIPTIETFYFLASGGNLELKIRLLNKFNRNHFLFKHHILEKAQAAPNEPASCAAIRVSDEYQHYFLMGERYQPDFSASFPAKKLHTNLEWDDLVLDNTTMSDLVEIKSWIAHGETLMKEWKLQRRLKRGYRSLFHGPPGTGKTLAAALLAKSCGVDAYAVDLSQIVSKYIGETEKNLAGLFDRAENRNWILFFDEADALFGKRTQVSDSKDRYANQEVAYLLQRMEDFPGVVILATNYKTNVDDAFLRRFQSVVGFSMPDKAHRLLLWQQTFSEGMPIAEDVDFEELAAKYNITGAAIANVLRNSSLAAISRGDQRINREDLIEGVLRELRKEGKA